MNEKSDYLINDMIVEEQRVSTEDNLNTFRRIACYMECLTKYQDVREADMESLVSLITRAKGPSRSMRQFAEAVGVSPATMSRIMNQKTSGPLNNELIVKIAANADPQSGITLDMLLKANGEEKKETITRQSLFEEARKGLLDELVKRGYFVLSAEQENSAVRSGPGFRMQFDFAIETDALGNGDKKGNKGNKGKRFGKWLFDFKSTISPTIDAVQPSAGTVRFRQWLTMVMGLFYCGAAGADRISYVVDNRNIFDQAKEILEGICIANEISVILVQNGRVLEEFVAPISEGRPQEVFFEINESKESMDSMEEYDWDMDVFSGK